MDLLSADIQIDMELLSADIHIKMGLISADIQISEVNRKWKIDQEHKIILQYCSSPLYQAKNRQSSYEAKIELNDMADIENDNFICQINVGQRLKQYDSVKVQPVLQSSDVY